MRLSYILQVPIVAWSSGMSDLRKKYWNRCYRKWHEHFTAVAGSGGSFGWDMPTMHMLYPVWLLALRRLTHLALAERGSFVEDGATERTIDGLRITESQEDISCD